MPKKLAVIGAGNMAAGIIDGILGGNINISEINIFDLSAEKCNEFAAKSVKIKIKESTAEAVECSDYVLIAVKPQNFPTALANISKACEYKNKIYISIGAGVSIAGICAGLPGAKAVRVMPNLPMTEGLGVSVICRNNDVFETDFDFVCDIFRCAGRILIINEDEMNRYIGVTASSPAYIIKFIDAMCFGAKEQGLKYDRELTDAVCDVLIGAATLLKNSGELPKDLISKVASKGGTTEKALESLESAGFDRIIADCMKACTHRADELGKMS